VVYAAETLPWGKLVVEIVTEERLGVGLLPAAMTTGTGCDSCIVCVFWTFN
jgi:hypothetical protein